MPPCCHPARCCPRLGSARTPRASGWPALDTAGRPPARTAAHGQDGWLGTGSLHGWSCSGGGCSGVEIGFKVADREQHIPHPLYGCAARSEYRQYKATFHARPPASASQHLTSAPPAPLGFLSPSQGLASDACCTMAVDTPAQRTYTGAHPAKCTADASRHGCVYAGQSNAAALRRPQHPVTRRRSPAWRAVQRA